LHSSSAGPRATQVGMAGDGDALLPVTLLELDAALDANPTLDP
jgi:hypothetical protein